MKKKILKFGHRPVNFAAKMNGRNSRVMFAAYRSDGKTKEQIEAEEEAAFEASIKDLTDEGKATAKAVRAQCLAFRKEIEAGMITREEADAQIKEAIDKETGELKTKLEKVYQASLKQGIMLQGMKSKSGKVDDATIMKLIEDNMDQIEKAFNGSREGDLLIGLKYERKKLTTKAPAEMTTGSIDYSALDGTEIDNFRIDAFVPQRRDREFIFDIADRTTVSEVPEHIIWDEEGDGQGAIAIVDEGALKPLVDFVIVENKSKAVKAAGKVIVTTEFEKFKKRAFQIIKGLFNDKVLRDYQGILTTNLIGAAASYIGTALDGTITNPNDYDAIGAVAAQLETLNFNPDVLIINPQDKWRMALSKNADGDYIARNIPVAGANGQVQFMSFRTITSNKIAVGSAILGEGKLWKIEDEAVTLRFGHGGTQNGGTFEHDFDYNRMRIIGEIFFHDYIATNHAGSFVEFEFEAVKAALEAPAMA